MVVEVWFVAEACFVPSVAPAAGLVVCVGFVDLVVLLLAWGSSAPGPPVGMVGVVGGGVRAGWKLWGWRGNRGWWIAVVGVAVAVIVVVARPYHPPVLVSSLAQRGTSTESPQGTYSCRKLSVVVEHPTALLLMLLLSLLPLVQMLEPSSRLSSLHTLPSSPRTPVRPSLLPLDLARQVPRPQV